jgi:restriction endonuclease Mrr
MNKLPAKKDLMVAIADVMSLRSGVWTTSEINEAVAKQLSIPQELLEIEDSNCTGTEYSYRMRWARTELKQNGIIKSAKRGEWELV